MKLVVQIPCRDEADTLGAVIAAIPSAIDGVDQIEVLVLDDGSRDGSARIAALAGARVLSSPEPVGLARTFAAGLQEALRHDADLIANLDGDGQYDAAELPWLLAPILRGEADLVVGDRSPATLRHFSWRKRLLQRLGGVAVRLASGVAVADPVSGYRVLTRSAASRLEIRGPYTYTIEMLVQVRGLGLRLHNVPITARPTLRPSRLMKNDADYLWRAGGTAARAMLRHRPGTVGVFGLGVAALILVILRL